MSKIQMSFSHVGLFVVNLDVMVAFYQRVLGLTVTDRGLLPGRELAFLSGDPREHHQVVLASGRTGALSDKVVNQVSFRVTCLEDLQDMYQRLRIDTQASDLRCINHGNAWTLYFRDPEGNRLELFVDTPWYIAQPRADALDLGRPANEIRDETEKFCRQAPSFMPAEIWRAALADRINAPTATPKNAS